jgi:hypothetical protein
MTRFLEFCCDECGMCTTVRDRVFEWQGSPLGWSSALGQDLQTRHLCPKCAPQQGDVTEFVQVLADGGLL